MSNMCKGDDGTKGKSEREKNIGLFFDIETSRYRYSDKEKEEKAELIYNYLEEHQELSDDEKELIIHQFEQTMEYGTQLVYLTNLYIVDLSTKSELENHYFRTMKETVDFLKEWGDKNKQYICYVHNLSYEYVFLSRELNGNAKHSKELNEYGLERPKCIIMKGSVKEVAFEELPHITFRCSYALLNKSVKQLGEELSLPKLPYQYDKLRLPTDELEDLDYEYNHRDNVIVMESVYNRFFKTGKYNLSDIPLTFTGDTRREIIKTYKEINKGEKYPFKNTTGDVYHSEMSYDFYRLWEKCYTGGYVSGNAMLLSKFIKYVLKVDFTSSYPYEMVTKYFPIYGDENSKYPCIKLLDKEIATDYFNNHLRKYNHKELRTYRATDNIDHIKGYMGTFRILNPRIVNPYLFYPLSKSKISDCLFSELIEINGKMKEANGWVEFSCSNIQLDIILDCYYYDDIEVNELYMATKEKRLPKEQIDFILKNYRRKNEIKQIKKSYPDGECPIELEIEYILVKIYINSVYGIKCEKLVKEFSDIIDGQIMTLSIDREDFLKTYLNKTSKEVYDELIRINKGMKKENHEIADKKFLHRFTDGMYITDYARYHLFDCMFRYLEVGLYPIMCDTDSLAVAPLKAINGEILTKSEEKEMIETFLEVTETHNEEVRNKYDYIPYFISFCEENQLDEKEIEQLKELGTLDIESKSKMKNGKKEIKPYDLFCTLGCKKYAYIETNWNDEEKRYKKSIHSTVAGLSKGYAKHIENYANQEEISYEKALTMLFKDKLLVDNTISGRMTSRISYLPPHIEELINPYQQRGGVMLDKATYCFSIKQSDKINLKLINDEEQEEEYTYEFKAEEKGKNENDEPIFYYSYERKKI